MHPPPPGPWELQADLSILFASMLEYGALAPPILADGWSWPVPQYYRGGKVETGAD